jgi:hypothetical protein
VFKSICLFKLPARGRIWGSPTGDAFAGAPKGIYKASRHFTMFAASTALADAFVRDWNLLAGNLAGRTLVWAFSPVPSNRGNH